MKKILIILAVLVVVGAGYWYASREGWFARNGPDNLPTAEEWKRMEEIERTSATIAPNAKPGIQVREPGSTPPPTANIEVTSSSTDATSTSSLVE